ncbi:MAG: LPS assembly lipoprotein LptE [Acidobacteriota bacterium]
MLITQLACGYRVASRNRLPADVEAIAILPLENETTTFEVEQILTQSLVRAFVGQSSYRVTSDPSKADALLRGVVSRVSANPVIFGQETFGSTFLVTLNARIELRERQTGKVLFQNDDYIFREQYVINVDVKNFFSELNPALRRIANDFASSVVTTILERF